MKEKAEHSFPLDVVLKILLLLGFSTFFLYAVFSGAYVKYVHPRILPYMVFTAAVMILTSIFMFTDVLKSKKFDNNSWGLIFFVIPLILAFTIPSTTLSSQSQVISNVQISNNTSTDNNSSESKTATEEKIIMTEKNYYSNLYNFFSTPEAYVGQTVEMVGLVYVDDSLTDNQFVIARYIMTCCAADMVPVGFLCRYDKASELTTDTWVKVTGTIGKTQYEGETVPYIKAENVEKAEKPVNEYVYPY